MKLKMGTFIKCIAIPLLVGAGSALLSGGGMRAFGELNQPPLSPPGWLLLLWALILATILLYYRISKPAAYLLIPYLVWVTFAGYLNLGIWYLN